MTIDYLVSEKAMDPLLDEVGVASLNTFARYLNVLENRGSLRELGIENGLLSRHYTERELNNEGIDFIRDKIKTDRSTQKFFFIYMGSRESMDEFI